MPGTEHGESTWVRLGAAFRAFNVHLNRRVPIPAANVGFAAHNGPTFPDIPALVMLHRSNLLAFWAVAPLYSIQINRSGIASENDRPRDL